MIKNNFTPDEIAREDGVEGLFPHSPRPCENCRFDTKFKDAAIGVLRYKEYKSLGLLGSIRQKQQFLNYLSDIRRASQLKYVFNAKKLTEAQARTIMRDFIKKNKEKTWMDMNTKLKEELTMIDNPKFDDFTDSIIDSFVDAIVIVTP